MRSILLGLGIAAFLGGSASPTVTAQTPVQPPAQLPSFNPPPTVLAPTPSVAPTPTLQRFDNTSLRVSLDGGKWHLFAGTLLLKDFGSSEREASEAIQVFRDLRINSHASIGGVFDCWLTDGEAPYSFTGRRQIIPFDPKSLRVEQMNGQWVLRDAHIVLYAFGSSQVEAQQALAVCQRFQFNELGYVGHPTPSLKYLMKDPTPRPTSPTLPSIQTVSAAMQASELPHPRLVLSGAGDIGDRVPFDGRRLDLRHEGNEWVLYAGRAAVGHFGTSDRDARAALEALEQFRVTEMCRIGDSGFSFFLCNGKPPQGAIIGTGAKALRTEMLTVREVAGAWSVCEGARPLFTFGDKPEDARHLLAAIKEFRFDHVALIGNGRLGHVYLFVKTRS
jgi:hypothetical protein